MQEEYCRTLKLPGFLGPEKTAFSGDFREKMLFLLFFRNNQIQIRLKDINRLIIWLDFT